MRTPDSRGNVGYYFALPRLLARARGHSAERSEQNWLEANLVGALVHGITFIFAARLLVDNRAIWQQVVLLVPLALLVCAWWSLFFYLNALFLKLLRAASLMRSMPDRRAQSLLVGIATTLLAWQLVAAGSWMQVPGLIWIIAVALNLVAAGVLALIHVEPGR